MKTLKDNLTEWQSFEKVAFHLSTVLGLGIENEENLIQWDKERV